ncbi:MAG: tRNA (adenosine(37)-N6)-dimethylallyltransferase MiaA [Thiobacillaceae bacterium]|nr:tRNA (adenosine(37)-N6)-dimethylallyltransferase MiaA [Thiobacillaceae bacterium]
MGPTASGKTALALQLAQRYAVEVVSVDSAQIYRGMDIGTAKPGLEQRAAVPHHLIDILEPTESYSAGRFRTDALRLVGEICARGRLPLLVGGTMLYFRALKHGLDPLPPADPAVRADLDARAAREGWPALHAELARLDPAAAARIRPHDAQRIQRALEVCLTTGRPLSQLQTARAQPLPFRLVEIALLPADRAALARRIAERFEAMLAEGFLDEVRRLRAAYPLRPELPAMRSVGYRQAWEHLEGRIDYATFKAQAIAATRQLAKRQMTWLRSWQGAQMFDGLHPNLGDQVTTWLRGLLVG